MMGFSVSGWKPRIQERMSRACYAAFGISRAASIIAPASIV